MAAEFRADHLVERDLADGPRIGLERSEQDRVRALRKTARLFCALLPPHHSEAQFHTRECPEFVPGYLRGLPEVGCREPADILDVGAPRVPSNSEHVSMTRSKRQRRRRFTSFSVTDKL